MSASRAGRATSTSFRPAKRVESASYGFARTDKLDQFRVTPAILGRRCLVMDTCREWSSIDLVLFDSNE